MIISTLPIRPSTHLLLTLMVLQLVGTFDGHLSMPVTSVCEDLLMAQEGKMFFCSKFTGSFLDTYINTGSGFEFHQRIQLIGVSLDMKIRGQDRLYLSFDYSIRIYENINNAYQETYSLPFLSPIYNIDVSEDEEILVTGHTDGKVEVYQKSGSTFTLHQTLTDASNSILPVDLSANRQKLATFEENTNLVRIYESSSGMFILKQTLSIPFQAFEIFLEESIMEVHGHSPLMLFYELTSGTFTLA